MTLQLCCLDTLLFCFHVLLLSKKFMSTIPMGLNHQLPLHPSSLKSQCWASVCWRLCWLLLCLKSECFQCDSVWFFMSEFITMPCQQNISFICSECLHLLNNVFKMLQHSQWCHPIIFFCGLTDTVARLQFLSCSFEWNKAFATVVCNSSLLFSPT